MTFIILLLLSCISLFSQSQKKFEGKITYFNVYKSKMANVSDAQFTDMMGSTQEYYIKNARYKSVVNGSVLQWQLFVPSEKKLYTKMSNAEQVFWNDSETNSDEVIKSEIKKSVTIILGYDCDELILTCKSGIQKYYYNATLSIDPILFSQHKYGNWHEFVSRSKALPLKSIIESPQFTFESTAVSVNPMLLEESFFDLAPGTKTMKSPY